jgi:hypothetical protein
VLRVAVAVAMLRVAVAVAVLRVAVAVPVMMMILLLFLQKQNLAITLSYVNNNVRCA